MSSLGVTSLGRFDLASRIVLDASTGSWFVVGLGGDQGATLLADDIESISDESVAVMTVDTGDSLVAGSRQHANEVALFLAPVALEALHLDAARSNLQRAHAAVLAIPPAQLSRLASVAPHFASWAGNRAFLIEEDRFLDSDAQEERLEALRQHYSMSDEEFLAMIQRGDSPLEPEHTEWLVLLGRQDLLRGDR